MNTFQSNIVYREERLLYLPNTYVIFTIEGHAELTHGYTGAQKWNKLTLQLKQVDM